MIDLTKTLFLDGGTGSILMERCGKPAGYLLERLNVDAPRIVYELEAEYVAAGSDVIFTNTFGANAFKFPDCLENIIRCGVDIACEVQRDSARRIYTALDIGPLGKIIGEGGITADEAYEHFARIIRSAQDRTDLIVIETMTDLAELRAAVLAAKENSRLQILTSMSFGANGRTAFGNAVENYAYTMRGMGVAAIGINCSLGPVEMLPLAEKLVRLTDLPVFIKPNAGMPSSRNGIAVYDIDCEAFASAMAQIKGTGVKILGGCCGTTPNYIRSLVTATRDITAPPRAFEPHSVVCSATRFVRVDSPRVVGERINPTGKKAFQQALRDGDYDYVLAQGVMQADEGADILDVNVGINGIDQDYAMQRIIKGLAVSCDLPLCIDSSSPQVIEHALRTYCGKAIVNSVNGSEDSMNAILPIVAKYGAAVVALTLDESGIPTSIDDRLHVAERIISRCREYGIPLCDIYVDTLTMAEASSAGNALCTLGALHRVKELGVHTILGISNISFGMPNREDINVSFMEQAIANGLDLCIINPKLKNIQGSTYAHDFLQAKPNSTQAYIEYATRVADRTQSVTTPTTTVPSLQQAIIQGQRSTVTDLVSSMLSEGRATEDITAEMLQALDTVGRLYEEGRTFFLPQLIASADSAKGAFELIAAAMSAKGSQTSTRVFVLATVKGDIHDIGKNIVKAVVANYGYRIIDLGRDVDYEEVLSAVRTYYPCALGLSALMTTTAENMATTIRLVRDEYPDIPILVGGAVLTPEYAAGIGGIYCRDAADTVRQLAELDIFD